MAIPLKFARERSVLLRALAAVLTTCTIAAAGAPPATTRRPVIDTYHGVAVTDDYRWLETWDDPAVKQWSDAQNTYARSVLDGLPNVAAIRSRITGLHVSHTTYSRLTPTGGLWLALKHDPRKEQPAIVTFSNPDDLSGERVILDPEAIDPKGTTTIDWFVPSPDGKVLAVSLSEGGSERGNVHLIDMTAAKDLGDTVPRVHYGTAGGSLAWAGDGSGFYYTRYPRPGERPAEDLDFFMQVYFHKRGTPTASDRYEVGERFPRIAEIALRTSRDGRFVLANVANGDGGEFAQYLKGRDGRWVQLTHFEDKVVFGAFGGDGSLYLMSRNAAPKGRILRLPLSMVCRV